MSAHEEKLQASQPTQGTRARATRAQLERKYNFMFDAGDEIGITSMGVYQIWKRISGRGESAVFEQVS